MKESSSPQLQRGSEARWLIGTRHVPESAPCEQHVLYSVMRNCSGKTRVPADNKMYNPASSVMVPSAPCVDAKRARAVVGRVVSEIDLRCRFQRNEIEDRHNYFAFSVERRCSIQLGTIG